MTDAMTETLYCANHPQTPTSLRCNRCGKLICARCAVRTPVGYRCRDCTRAQQQVFETALWYDYLIAGIVAAVLGFIGSLMTFLPFFFVIFLAPASGGVIAEAVRFGVQRRRGRYLGWLAVAGFALGCLPIGGWLLLQALFGGFSFALLTLGLYAFLGGGALYARLRGISIG
jgi:MFS family permease